VQLPGGQGDRSGGERQYVEALARAAVAVGVDALFMEVHEDPDRTLPDGRLLSDGPNMLKLVTLPRLVVDGSAIARGAGGARWMWRGTWRSPRGCCASKPRAISSCAHGSTTASSVRSSCFTPARAASSSPGWASPA